MQVIQAEKGGWWGNELDAQEAMKILLNHEFGDLYSGGFPQPVKDVVVNQYNRSCSSGPWSARCINEFWGYSQVIREADRNINRYRGGGRWDNPAIVQGLTNLAAGVLNQTEVSIDKEVVDYGNILDDRAAAIVWNEYVAGNYEKARYVSPTRVEGQLTGVFLIQTYAQKNAYHCIRIENTIPTQWDCTF